jgi:hypothetical protein
MRRTRTFYVAILAILCACMVGRCLCYMVAQFHYLGVGGANEAAEMMENLLTNPLIGYNLKKIGHL